MYGVLRIEEFGGCRGTFLAERKQSLAQLLKADPAPQGEHQILLSERGARTASPGMTFGTDAGLPLSKILIYGQSGRRQTAHANRVQRSDDLPLI
jgi:hypothetical protein